MIKLDKVTNLLELVFYSAYIEGEQPISALVTAPPEAGKTENVMRFADNGGIRVLTDCTAYGIMRDYADPIRERKVRHLVIPDLVRPLSRGKDTVHGLVAFLNSLVEEGVISVSTYAETIGVPKDGEKQDAPVKCGLVATLAREVLTDGRHGWAKMGFMSRLVPISYDYSIQTQREIQKSIAKREYVGSTPITLDLPEKDVAVALKEHEANQLLTLTALIAPSLGGTGGVKPYGFRLQKHIQRLAMASAIKHKREVVTMEDVDFLNELSTCMNLDYYPL